VKKSMKLSFRALWVGAVLACLAVIGHADEAAEADEVKDVTDAKGGQALVERLTALRPGIPIEQVRETPSTVPRMVSICSPETCTSSPTPAW
jgi:hypothetical protein